MGDDLHGEYDWDKAIVADSYGRMHVVDPPLIAMHPYEAMHYAIVVDKSTGKVVSTETIKPQKMSVSVDKAGTA